MLLFISGKYTDLELYAAKGHKVAKIYNDSNNDVDYAGELTQKVYSRILKGNIDKNIKFNIKKGDMPAAIDITATIGAGTVIEQGVRIEDKVKIGKNCVIGANSTLHKGQFADGAIVPEGTDTHAGDKLKDF